MRDREVDPRGGADDAEEDGDVGEIVGADRQQAARFVAGAAQDVLRRVVVGEVGPPQGARNGQREDNQAGAAGGDVFDVRPSRWR